MDNAAVLSVDELLALNSHLRQQAKQDAVMNTALQLQLRENDETISMLRHSCSAAAKSAPVMEGQRCTCASKESEIRFKEQMTLGLSLTVNCLSEEREKLLAKNESLLEEMTMKDEKRRSWQKELKRRLLQLLQLLKEGGEIFASAATASYPQGTNEGVPNPLPENDRPE